MDPELSALPHQQSLDKANNQTLKWILVLVGLVVFGGLFGAGVYGILHSFDLYGGPSTSGEKLFSAFAPIGLIGGLIYFAFISSLFTKPNASGRNIIRIIGNVILYVLFCLVFAALMVFVSNSYQLIEKYDNYLINRNEAQRQDVIENTNLHINFQPTEVTSYGINKEFAVLVIKGQLSGLESASSVTSYMNVVGMEKLIVNNKQVDIPKPNQWSNMPSTISLGTDEPPQVSFASGSQEIVLLVIVPAGSLQTQGVNTFSGTIAIWSQSENTFDQEIFWRQDITSEVKSGKDAASEKVLQNYLMYKTK